MTELEQLLRFHTLSERNATDDAQRGLMREAADRIDELQRQREDLRYGLAEFCRACEEAPPIKFMEWLGTAHEVGKAILERNRL